MFENIVGKEGRKSNLELDLHIASWGWFC